MISMKNLLRFLIRLRNDQIPRHPPFSSYESTEAGVYLQQLMRDNYTIDNLAKLTPDQFQSHITGLQGKCDTEMEGYVDPAYQRDLSVQFEWGHNHDFGAFHLPGRMGDRHIDILATFATVYGIPPLDLRGKTILDIGCWTGGTSLLLAAMGAEVFAIEEVHKYGDCVSYLKEAFGITKLTVKNMSLYSLDQPEFFDRFDIVLYFGVLYHVSDPILSLRIIFNCLKDDGICLLETMAAEKKGSYCEYLGANQTLNHPKDGKNRGGWNWFVPSLGALTRMMTDVGFTVRQATFHHGYRALALGVRNKHVDMLRAGLSNRFIR
jgi:2-polyprenyl-3-methyl-5-hydroxy-6-metoxy-1,4-benzoquinol methylase